MKRLIFILAFLALISPAAAWYDADWAYRKLITLNATVAADTQVKIAVTYAAGMAADFDDIRFIQKSDDNTVLKYYLERKTDSTSAVFWVKLNNDDEVYMYYGHADAASRPRC